MVSIYTCLSIIWSVYLFNWLLMVNVCILNPYQLQNCPNLGVFWFSGLCCILLCLIVFRLYLFCSRLYFVVLVNKVCYFHEDLILDTVWRTVWWLLPLILMTKHRMSVALIRAMHILVFPVCFYSFQCVTFSDFDLQIPSIHILRYTTEVLGVILALLDDSDDSVQLTAVTCLLMVFTPAFLTAYESTYVSSSTCSSTWNI